ncbi:hypothetical protein DPMN_163557 [Dreissena polymorpha]|uniref:Uncharacterized protein n=1 Tax=Dreissena polymorpha TaxID=45954 RepID=A0A9D4IUP3_DREPO|nr:hypothetical protein DPMN_163557 [Dreissena polymorpha]
MRESSVTGVMGMEEEGWYERVWCHWFYEHGRKRLVSMGALSMVSWSWKKKVVMRESGVTGVMGMGMEEDKCERESAVTVVMGINEEGW